MSCPPRSCRRSGRCCDRPRRPGTQARSGTGRTCSSRWSACGISSRSIHAIWRLAVQNLAQCVVNPGTAVLELVFAHGFQQLQHLAQAHPVLFAQLPQQLLIGIGQCHEGFSLFAIRFAGGQAFDQFVEGIPGAILLGDPPLVESLVLVFRSLLRHLVRDLACVGQDLSVVDVQESV
ncbi:hypothetical protein THIOKS12960006 [Thiocapsa sp. KS1]|nr:hypothetical protein THIOKS12960006 [Thiocapsa sp. KS1]